MGNGRQQEAVKGTHFQQRKQNNVCYQGQQQQHIPSKQIVGKSVRIKGAQDPIHNGRGKDSDRDIQGEIIGLQLSNPFFPY